MFFSIERKLLYALLLVGGLTVLIGVLSLATTRSQSGASTEVMQTQRITELTEQMLSDLKDLEVGQRGYLLTADPAYLLPYRSARERIWGEYEKLERLTAGQTDLNRRVTGLKPLISDKIAEVDSVLAFSEKNGIPAAIDRVRTNQGKNAMDDIRRGVEELKKDQRLLYEQRWNSYRILSRANTFVLVSGKLLILTLLFFAGRTMRREMIKLDAANRRLNENDRWLQFALNAGNAGMWSWDPASGQVLWSEDHYTLYGRKPCSDHLTFDDWMNMVFPADQEHVSQVLREAVETRSETDFEFRILMPDGKVRWVFLRGQVMCEEGSSHIQVTGISGNISALKESQETLRESEARFRQLVDRIEDVFWILDVKTGKSLYVSPAYERLWGLPIEDVLADSAAWTDRIHPDDIDRTNENFANAVQSSGVDQEYRVILLDGQVKWVRDRSFPIVDESGETSRMVGITEDITARKEFEQERERLLLAEREARRLAELAENRFRNLTETVPGIVWTSRPDGTTSYHNKRWQEYTGRMPEESLGWEWKDALHPEDLEATVTNWTRAIANTEPFEAEFRLRRVDDVHRWFLARGIPILDQSGEVEMWIGTCTDIHEHKRSQEIRAQLLDLERQARDEAESANRSKDEFVALVSHELRSPLNAMLGWARVLGSEKVDPAIAVKAVKTIEQSANTQLRLIEDLLDTARIITGKLKLELGPVELCAVIEAALEVLRPSVEAKGLELSFIGDPSVEVFHGDADRLQQVVWNLVSNAVKFTPARGHIEVSIRKVEPSIELRVRDSGRGIAPDTIPLIFNRFNQGSSSGAKRATGLGLGLSLVRYIVELHGGTIRAESEGEGRGATFIVDLPLPENRRIDRSTTGGMAPVTLDGLASGRTNGKPFQSAPLRFAPTLAGLRVLVVDDEEEVRDLVSTLLHNFGAEVTLAASARDALDVIQSENGITFDAIVSDIGMPELDGYSFIRTVRDLPAEQGGRTPAVALTAFGRTNDRIRALESGFQMHLAKPVEPAELMMVVAGLCGRRIERM